jgi:hypothetical protein
LCCLFYSGGFLKDSEESQLSVIDFGSGGILPTRFFISYAFLSIIVNFWINILWTSIHCHVFDIFLLAITISADISSYGLGIVFLVSLSKKVYPWLKEKGWIRIVE